MNDGIKCPNCGSHMCEWFGIAKDTFGTTVVQDDLGYIASYQNRADFNPPAQKMPMTVFTWLLTWFSIFNLCAAFNRFTSLQIDEGLCYILSAILLLLWPAYKFYKSTQYNETTYLELLDIYGRSVVCRTCGYTFVVDNGEQQVDQAPQYGEQQTNDVPQENEGASIPAEEAAANSANSISAEQEVANLINQSSQVQQQIIMERAKERDKEEKDRMKKNLGVLVDKSKSKMLTGANNLLEKAQEEDFANKIPVKKIAIAAAVAIVCVGGYFMFGKFGVSRYESKVNSYAEAASVMPPIIAELELMDENYDQSAVDAMAAKLESAAANLKSIHDDLKSTTPPDKYSVEHIRLVKSIELERAILLKTAEVLAPGRDIEKVNGNVQELTAKQNAIIDQIKFEGIDFSKLKEQPKLVNLLAKYTVARKEKRSKEAKEIIAKGRKAQHEKVKNFREKTEVVYVITQVTRKDGEVELYGEFYNGTDKPVSRVTKMQIDVEAFDEINNPGKVMAAIKGYNVPEVKFSSILKPKQSAVIPLTIPIDGVKAGPTTHFSAEAHDLTWMSLKPKKQP